MRSLAPDDSEMPRPPAAKPVSTAGSDDAVAQPRPTTGDGQTTTGPRDLKGRTETGFERHVFVCTNERAPGHRRGCCGAENGGRIREMFRTHLDEAGLKGRVRANTSACLDFCEFGPTVVVYPEGVWYSIQDPGRDVPEIVASHLVDGTPVDRCLMRLT